MFITKKKLEELKKAEYNRGLNVGYQAGWGSRSIEESNKGIILGSKVDQQLEDILRKKGL